MNDFTKDELENLQYCMRQMTIHINNYDETYNKIQSLIDNYPKCDHRSGMNHYNEKGEAVGYDSDIYKCRYCDTLFKFLYENGICIGNEELE